MGLKHWVVVLSCVQLATGCAEPEENGASKSREPVGQLTAPLTSSELSMLGFETMTWASIWNPAVLSQSTLHSQGQFSLKIANIGYTAVRHSPALQSDGTSFNVVGYDIRIPPLNEQVNPWWFGDTWLYIDAPSKGINQVTLGTQVLKNPGQFTRYEFAIPTSIRTALAGNYSDLKFTIAINTTPGNGAHYVDRFTLGPGTCVPENDNNPCTLDGCNSAGHPTHTPQPAGTSCSDSDQCNGSETCNASGACQAGTPPLIDDGNLCTTDSCNPATGVLHVALPSGTSCSDNNTCNGAELCNATAVCTSGTPPPIDDGNPCTADSCDPQSGVQHVPVPGGTSCSNGNACDGTELCNSAGACQPGTAPVTDDGNPCTADSCDPQSGVVHVPVSAGTSCGDANACNGSEICNGAGICAPGTVPPVDDGNPCTADSCDPLTGVAHSPVPSGTTCADADQCNGSEACNGSGVCVVGTPSTIDDGNPCTADSCSAATGVAHVPLPAGTSCADDDVCNGTELCSAAAVCQPGTPLDPDDENSCTVDECDPVAGIQNQPTPGASCADNDLCNGAEVCSSAGTCVAGAPLDPDDGNPCTTDTCDPVAGIDNVPVAGGTSCADTDVCNGTEICDGSGSCEPSPPLETDDQNPCTADSCDPVTGIEHTAEPAGTSCSDGDVCTGAEVCDGSGTCEAGAPLDADDGNPCTADSCDPVAGVVHSPVANGTVCNDNDACTQADVCQAGACTGAQPVVCTALDQCHGVGTCNSATGACSNPVLADGTTCNDGNACTQSDGCVAGACTGANPILCSALDSCHVPGSCDSATGLCDSPAAPDGTVCEDSDACTAGDSCSAGACVPGDAVDVDDENPCTADSCDATNGVTHTPLAAGTVCAASGPCTGEGTCDGSGVCQAGPVGVEDDGNPCTADACDPVNGPVHLALPNGSACSDANVCNGAETCSNGACLPGTPLNLPESENPCILGYTCDALTGLTASYASSGTECGEGMLCDGAGQCLRDQGDGSLPPPPEPGALTGIDEYGPSLPRDPVDDCALEPLDPKHVAVVAGSVVYWDAASGEQLPAEGARVTIERECRLGAVWTSADGTFRIPVNGGQRVTVHVEWDLDGDGVSDYLPAERSAETRWQGTTGIGEVELVAPEEPAGTVDAPGGVVTADIILNGPASVDDRNGDGIASVRTPSVFLQAGTQITAVDELGATLDLDQATIRMTEYTVGVHGDDRMPAPMPPGTAYGYAVELAVDGAEQVFFDQPAVFYLDNFLGAEATAGGGASPELEVGMPVPAWFYDRALSAWQGMDDGIILRIVGVNQTGTATALIDADGDGDADQADVNYLSARGVVIGAAEREQLATEVLAGRRSVGTELWRVEVDHFSTFDWNWILQCGLDCLVGNAVPDPKLWGQNGAPMCKAGSAIDVETRSLREAVPIAGTPFTLNYDSRFAYGYAPRRQARVDRAWPTLPAPVHVVGVSERLALGGKSMNLEGCQIGFGGVECHEFEGFSTPFQDVVEWDGRDANGQLAIGTHHGQWMTSTRIRAGNSTSVFMRDFPKIVPVSMTVYDSRVIGLGGWTLSPQHVFDKTGSTLFRGDGGERHAVGATIKAFYTYSTPALQPPNKDLVALPDGGFIMSDYRGTRYLSPQQALTTVATAQNNALAAVSADQFFVGDSDASGDEYLRRYDRVNGVWQEGAYLQRSNTTHSLAVGPDNLVYTLEMTSPISIRRYTLDLEPTEDEHVVATLPGSGSTSSSSAMSFHGDTLYFALGPECEIYRLDADADAPVLIGRGGAFGGQTITDGQRALSLPAEYCHFTSIHATSDGVFWSRGGVSGIWRIDDEGRLRHVAGLSGAAFGSGDGGPPQNAGIGSHTAFDFDANGDLILLTVETGSGSRTLRRVSWTGKLDVATLPNDDGTLSYEFDSSGRHLRTINTQTADVVYSFEYTDGFVTAVVHGNNAGPDAATLPRTTIDRGVTGQVTIQAPSGQQTTLLINPDTGYAYAIVDAAGNTTSLTHDSGGLLQQMTDTRGFVHSYTYDAQGQLETDTSPGLAPQVLSGKVPLNVQHTSGENEVSSYQVSLGTSGYRPVTRNIVNADASSSTSTADSRLNRTRTSSDGTTVQETYTLHPTFLATAPVLASRMTALPSGLQRAESHSLSFTSGRWQETFGVGGDVATKETDPATNTITFTSPRGRRVVTVLDAQNRPIQTRLGDLSPINSFYDSVGRLTQTVSGSGSSARTTTLDYYPDDTGMPEAGYLMAFTDAANQNLEFTRDAFGRALSQTVGDHTTSFGFTNLGDLDTIVTANDDAHVQDYNGVNLISAYFAPTVAGTDGTTTYAYDNDRRLTTLSLPGGVTIAHIRDGASPEYPERQGRLRQVLSLDSGGGTSPFEIGYAYADEVVCADPDDPSTCPPAGPPAQLASLTRGDITTRFTFDGSALVGEQHEIAATSASGLRDTAFGTTLNAKFLPQSDRVTVADDVFTASYSYDADALLTCAASGTTCSTTNGVNYLFDNRVGDPTPSRHGLLEGTTAQAIEEIFSYNTFGELSTHQVRANAATVRTINYGTRDPNGRILTQTTTRPGSTSTVSYTYDAQGQLYTVTPGGGATRTNVYDANGNRLCTYEAPATDCDEVAVYDAQDRLLEAEGIFYSYTDRGSLYQRDDGSTVETFTYDALGNLTQVARSGGETIEYIIDSQGRRVGKQVDGVLAQQFVWSGPLRIAAELNGAGEVTSRFVYGHGINVPALIVKLDAVNGDRTYRVITDHLGSPIYVVNVANPSDVLLDATYDEWGNVTAYTSSTGAWPIPFGFAGGLYDEDTGLVRFGARDYDPRVGRWTSKDPIRFRGGQGNLYVYAGNEPVHFADPTGQVISPATAGLIILGAALAGGTAEYLMGDRGGADLAFGAATGAVAGVGAVVAIGGAPLVGLPLTVVAVLFNTVWNDSLTDAGGLVDTASGTAGGLLCNFFTGPIGLIACPFAEESAESASEDCRGKDEQGKQ